MLCNSISWGLLCGLALLFSDPTALGAVSGSTRIKLHATIGGSGNLVAKLLPAQSAPSVELPSTATDTESSTRFDYSPKDCEDLFTDMVKQIGYPLVKELAQVAKIDDSYEIAAGEQLDKAYRVMCDGRLDLDGEWVRYVNDVGQNLVRGAFRNTITYRFHIVDSDTLDVFSIPGSVFIYRGLLEHLDNEAELAFVLAHEIGHIDLRHCIAMTHFIMNLPKIARREQVFDAADMIRNSFSTEMEIEADNYALKACYRNNYSPYQAVRLFLTVFNEGLYSSKPANILDKLLLETSNIMQSHPQTTYRLCKIRNSIYLLQHETPKEKFYLGKQNYRLKIPMHYAIY